MSFDHDRLTDVDIPSYTHRRLCDEHAERGEDRLGQLDMVGVILRMVAVVAVLGLLTSYVFSDQEVSVKPGRLKKITTTLDGCKILWRPIGDFDLIEDSSGKSATTLFPAAGKYSILVITAKGDEPKTETITVTVEGDAPKPPPGPGPGPDPKPDPIDKFTSDVVASVTSDPSPTRFADAGKLAELYEEAARKTVHDSSVSTLFQLHRVLSAARSSLIGDRLPSARKLMDAEMNREFGDGATIDTGLVLAIVGRDRVASVFSKFAVALRRAK